MSCLLKLRPSTWLSYLLQEFQAQSGHLICHRGAQHPGKQERGDRRHLPTPVVNFLRESPTQRSTRGMHPGVTEGSDAVLSVPPGAPPLPGAEEPHVPWKAESRANTCIALAVGCQAPQTGRPWVAGFLLRVLPRPRLVPKQGLPANTAIPRCGQVGLPGRAKMGSSWGPGTEQGPGQSIVPIPPCSVPTLRTEPRRGWCCGEGAAYPFPSASIAASRRPGGPWPLPGTIGARQEQSSDSRRTGWGHQLPVDFRNFLVVGARQTVTHLGASQVGLDVQPSHGHLAGP